MVGFTQQTRRNLRSGNTLNGSNRPSRNCVKLAAPINKAFAVVVTWKSPRKYIRSLQRTITQDDQNEKLCAYNLVNANVRIRPFASQSVLGHLFCMIT